MIDGGKFKCKAQNKTEMPKKIMNCDDNFVFIDKTILT